MNRKNIALAIAGVPTLSGCFCLPGYCGAEATVAWNGRHANGNTWDGTSPLDCSSLCPDSGFVQQYNQCTSPDAGLLTCHIFCTGGRAPPGLLSLSGVTAAAGSWVARMAELEAAAVTAFQVLGDELEAHGLPSQAIRKAARDEVRHARVVTGLALSMGFMPRAPQIELPPTPRTLEQLALDNAGEGCGRELFGAVINEWQAEHAADENVRAVMASIAADERAHAETSFQLAEALSPRVSAAVRRGMREAQELTLATLAADEVPESLRERLGLPDADRAKATVRRLLDTARL